MKLQRFSVHRPIALAMCILATLVFGILAFNRLNLDLLPNMEYPTLAVVTIYPNADAESIENQITRPVESALSTITGLKQLESTSVENVSLVLAHFNWGTDLTQPFDEINTLMSIVGATLPSDAQRPLVVKMDPAQLPLLQIGVTSDHDIGTLTRLVETSVRPTLERIQGVAQVSILGGAHPRIALYYNTQALRDARLTPIDLQTMLQMQNVSVPAGALLVSPDELGGMAYGDSTLRYPLRVGNTFKDADDLRDLIVSIPSQQEAVDSFGISSWLPPQPIRLGDVATVVEESVSPEGFTRINGNAAIIIRVLKQSGENTVTVSERVRSAIAELSTYQDLGLQFHVVTDQAEFITESVSSLGGSALLGGLLAMGVLLLFLRTARDLIVIGISIPFSVLVALILMHVSDLTLNLMTLGGLAIAMGMLVDNSIVVLENIFRLRDEGLKPWDAAIQGTAEMAIAITASTITTVAVFVPLFFLRSLAGNLFRDLALSVTYALIGSLLVALTVVPMLAAHLPDMRWPLRQQHRAKQPAHRNAGLFGWLQARYLRILKWTIGRPLFTLTLGIVLIAALLFTPRLMETGFLPAMDGGLVRIELVLPPGTPVSITDDAVRDVETALLAVPEVVTVSAQVGNQGADDFLSLVQETPVNQATIMALLVPSMERQRSAHDIAEELRASLRIPPDARVRISADRASDSLGEDYAMGLTLEIRGADWQRLEAISDQIATALRATPGFTDVTATAEEKQPELFFPVDRIQSARALLTAGHVGLNLRYAFTGLPATTIQQHGLAIPVVIHPEPDTISSLEALGSFRVFNLQRDQEGIPQASRLAVVTAEESPIVTIEPRAIQHIDRQRVVRVKAQLDGLDLTSSRLLAEAILDGIELPTGYEVRLAGIHATLDESLNELWVALALAVLFVYMVMAAQFESLRYPLIIMVTVPLAGVGAVAALWISGQQLNVPSLMGLITLTGICVNNGIVLVDTINRLRSEGASLDQAVLTAGQIRLRPILMTALTTILGLVPLALGWGEGTEIQVPLAVATMGGLLSSTLLTLVFVPAIYRLLALLGKGHAQPDGKLQPTSF